MQYRLPLPSGRLWPKWIPSSVTVSPLRKHRTLSHTTSSSRNEGQPWSVDSRMNSYFCDFLICPAFKLIRFLWIKKSRFLPGTSLWRNEEWFATNGIVKCNGPAIVAVLLIHKVCRGEVARVLGKVSIEAANLVRRCPINAPAQVLH